MKKFLFALAVLATLPFSTSHCDVNKEQVLFGCLVAAAAGTCYYYYHYKPSQNNTNTTNNPNKNTLFNHAAMPNQNEVIIPKNPQPEEKKTTGSASETPTPDVEKPVTKKPCFLTNVRNSIE